MRKWLAVFWLLRFGVLAQVPYDTIIDRGVYKSYFNRRLLQPVAVAYRLYQGGGAAPRSNDRFVGDSAVRTCGRSDYAHSGFDKGHLVPAEDFAFSDSLQNLTFRYYNCVPQAPRLNRGKWKQYENEVRRLSQSDTVVVVCYNSFTGQKTKRLYVPAACYKVVFDRAGRVVLQVGFENNSRCRPVEVSPELLRLMARLARPFQAH